ncbi:hypothetical protein M378DRAFT_26744 [Amanita muscaria Koide BX008]|uniref:Uncharacterized protein n=1 Tax=Amanita muscaria (strain Koide BX008) TaxID=946122 RepID=A0A0C2SB41_AMAMK|nr:hypothetical protein M378DRAFT_26744 [Amanita muscaria Koide BX008]
MSSLFGFSLEIGPKFAIAERSFPQRVNLMANIVRRSDASISVFVGSWAFPSTTPILTTSISYILAEYLIGLQAGHEPDFYATFGKRPAMRNDPLVLNRIMLLAPSIATGP